LCTIKLKENGILDDILAKKSKSTEKEKVHFCQIMMGRRSYLYLVPYTLYWTP
jgi:hypothetical protein